jgi:hypothetical protein
MGSLAVLLSGVLATGVAEVCGQKEILNPLCMGWNAHEGLRLFLYLQTSAKVKVS